MNEAIFIEIIEAALAGYKAWRAGDAATAQAALSAVASKANAQPAVIEETEAKDDKATNVTLDSKFTPG